MSDIDKVKELRKVTGAGFKDCNNALKETKGDIQKSIELLRVKGISKASKKMSRTANEGLVSIYKTENSLSIIEINCETDFVAKNEDFIKFVKEISEINNKVLSDPIKIENFQMSNGDTVKNNLVNKISKIGEKITIGRMATISEDQKTKNYSYMHSVVKDNLSKLGVIVNIDAKVINSELDEFGKQLSMHIAAASPLAIDIEQIDKDIIEKEMQLISKELSSTGKPQNIIDKISEGKIKKFKEDNSLLNQQWVMDPKKKVKDILSEIKDNTVKINSFYRIKIGE